MHDRIRRPSTWTVHAPHSPRSQDFLGPVRPNSSRNASRSVVRGSTLSLRGEPLTVILTSVRTSLCPGAGYVVVMFPGYLPCLEITHVKNLKDGANQKSNQCERQDGTQVHTGKPY